jgi:hypothetical protein
MPKLAVSFQEPLTDLLFPSYLLARLISDKWADLRSGIE